MAADLGESCGSECLSLMVLAFAVGTGVFLPGTARVGVVGVGVVLFGTTVFERLRVVEVVEDVVVKRGVAGTRVRI